MDKPVKEMNIEEIKKQIEECDSPYAREIYVDKWIDRITQIAILKGKSINNK